MYLLHIYCRIFYYIFVFNYFLLIITLLFLSLIISYEIFIIQLSLFSYDLLEEEVYATIDTIYDIISNT